MNFDTNSILFLFLFIFPGAFSKVLLNRFSPQYSGTAKSSYTELSEILASSVTILALNTVVIKVVTSIDFMQILYYILLTVATTAIFTIAFYYINKYGVLKVINWFNKKTGKPEESPGQTVWEVVFETKEYMDTTKPVVMAIEKDGILISRGLLAQFPAPQTACNDVVLQYNSAIEDIFREDNETFQVVDFEYCDFAKGVTFKFYNMEQYNKKYV